MPESALETVDYLVLAVINIVNVLMFFGFMARIDRPNLERKFMIAVMSMGVPALVSSIMYAVEERSWWHWAVPLVFVVWAVVEFAVDIIAKIELRHPKDLKILIPFIILFHLSLVGMWFLTWHMGTAFFITTGVFYAVHIGGMLYAQYQGVK